jgi:hypothetical protein
MNILIISRKETPEFIRYHFQGNNTKIFYSRGPIKSQNIFEKVNIHYILLFIDKNIKRIFYDLLIILNKNAIPVILITKKKYNHFGEKLKYHRFTISEEESEEKFLSHLNFCFNASPQNNNGDTSPDFPLAFKNFFKKTHKAQSNKESVALPLSSSLNISAEEKEELLADFKNNNQKK